jgi:Protein of unknown function (DUF4038)/Putative collagen-binding domain of a collagenase
MRKLILFLFFLVSFRATKAQFTISPDHHNILKDGKPFFWMGDTAWELFHRLSREDADRYFKRRSEQGFNVVQAVVLAEMDGLHTPNAYGEKPLINDDPTKPNEKYFEHVDFIIDKAASYNITIALLPTWADKVFKDRWGAGPEIFNKENAATYADWLSKRYKNKTNVIWILGGDRIPRNESDVAVWRAMGTSIMKETNNNALISYHSQPNQTGSAEWFRHDPWFSFNIFQNGHCRDGAIYDKIFTSYNSQPARPVIDAEPIYEDHPVCFNAADLGISSAYDVRKYAYLDLFAGAFGHTYGCHDIWQMYSPAREGINGPHFFWYDAMNLPGANEMQFVRKLMESHPLLDRIPDQSVIEENNYTPAERIQATRGNDYLYVYSVSGKPFTVNLEKIKATTFHSYWYNPKNGKSTNVEVTGHPASQKFTPPSSGYGQDWVLVVDDGSKHYPQP